MTESGIAGGWRRRWREEPVRCALIAALLAVAGLWLLAGLARYGVPAGGTTLAAAGGQVAGGDAMFFVAAGEAALSGRPATVYDVAATGQRLAALGAGDVVASWAYPPAALLVVAPLGALPPAGAILLWIAVLLAAAAALPALLLRAARAASFGPALPPAALAILSGQAAPLGALLLACWLRRGPNAAGIALGLLAVKPQHALMPALLALVERRWRELAVAAATALAANAASLAILGADLLPAFLAALPRHAAFFATGEAPVARLHTGYGIARSIGLGHAPSLVAHAAVALAAAGLSIALWRRGGTVDRALAAAGGSLLLFPGSYLYDYGLLAAPAALALGAWLAAPAGAGRAPALFAVIAALPPLAAAVAAASGLPLGAALLLALLAARAAMAGRA